MRQVRRTLEFGQDVRRIASEQQGQTAFGRRNRRLKLWQHGLDGRQLALCERDVEFIGETAFETALDERDILLRRIDRLLRDFEAQLQPTDVDITARDIGDNADQDGVSELGHGLGIVPDGL